MLNRELGGTLARARRSVLLLGPRQTGKSTLIRSLEPDLEVNLAREADFLAFSANASELEERINARRPATVFVDEVQRLPSLLNSIQALIDEAKHRGGALKFFLTGSSARKLRRGQANLLPGRILLYSLGPLCARELGAAFDPRRAMAVGTLPEPYLEPDEDSAKKLLESYAATYLKEEIQAEALSRNIEGFSRFLATAAACSGQLLDFSKLAQRAKVSRTSAVRYFEVLEDTLLAYRLEPYPEAASADLVKHPKLYLFDCGVLNGLLRNFVASPDRVGLLFEHLVVSQLRATAMALDRDLDLHTFRTRGGLEVDFIATSKGTTFAIEAKATSAVLESDAAGLAAARRYLPGRTRRVVVTPAGPARRLASGVEIMPLTELLARVFA